jgi:hypothetical protein
MRRLAARHRVEAALSAGAGASRLHRDSILCIRRIATSFSQLDHFASLLDAETSAAARPARDAVPANANAVFFADRAEMLACLARDWCRGNLGAAWWWPVLFRRDDLSPVVRLWLADIQAVPGALARLESAGWAGTFLAKISPADIAALWDATVKTFDLGPIDKAWSALESRKDDSGIGGLPGSAPWTRWITPDPSALFRVAQLLVTAVMLERAPGTIRSEAFARALRNWAEAARKEIDLGFSGQTAHLNHALLEEADRVEEKQSEVGHDPGETSSDATEMERTPRTNLAEDASAAPSTPEIDLAGVVSRLLPASEDGFSIELFGEGERARPAADDRGLLLAPDELGEDNASLASPELDRIATEWGGLLYLINVAIALELYGDFTAPARKGLPLALWDFLALLGERMIGKAFPLDPLSGLLARLAGRAEADSPGAQFVPPRRETLEQWLDRISEEMEDRVRQSIESGEKIDVREFILKQDAKIEAGPTRLDAHFSLADHPIELRLAGLDRDPGWVPAGGRRIHFHYE